MAPKNQTKRSHPPKPARRGSVPPAEASDAEQEENSEPSQAEAAPQIPPKLLTKMLHEFFADNSTRISKDANEAIAKYVETFVKEAIARAKYERESSAEGRGDGFLEVEDLEKLAPQLLLDF